MLVAAIEDGDAVAHFLRVIDQQADDGSGVGVVTGLETEGAAGGRDDRNVFDVFEGFQPGLEGVGLAVGAFVLGGRRPPPVIAARQFKIE